MIMAETSCSLPVAPSDGTSRSLLLPHTQSVIAGLQQQLRPSVRFSQLASDLAPGLAIESVPPAQACQWHTGTVALSEDRHSDGPSECFCAVRVSTRAPWLTFCSLFSIIINYSDYDLRNNLNIDNN